MPKIHNYYEELVNTHYNNHLDMCTQMGISLNEMYTDELDDDDFY